MKKYYLPFVLLLLLPILINSCALSHYDRLSTHYDQVKKEKRVKLKMVFLRTEERHTTFILSEKDFLKIISTSGKISYKVYDQLDLTANSYPLSDTMFLIVDDHAYPIKIRHPKIEIFHNTQTQNNKIMKVDSTSVTVISGIQENENKRIQFHYNLSKQEIDALKDAKTAAFRYYANPETFTLKISNHTLRQLKKFFAIQ